MAVLYLTRRSYVCERVALADEDGKADAGSADDSWIRTTTFATSTKSPEAQSAFVRGLLLLHLFEYQRADSSFVAAEKLDPGFAMAYWGEAMTFNHGVWNQVDVAAGKAALEKFAPTVEGRTKRIDAPRERAYMAAVELLYDNSCGNGAKARRIATAATRRRWKR